MLSRCSYSIIPGSVVSSPTVNSLIFCLDPRARRPTCGDKAKLRACIVETRAGTNQNKYHKKSCWYDKGTAASVGVFPLVLTRSPSWYHIDRLLICSFTLTERKAAKNEWTVLDMLFAFSASWDLLICGYLRLYLESVAEVADSFSKRQKCTVWNGATWYPGVQELVASLSLPGERVNKEGMEATQRRFYTKQEDRRNTMNSERWKRQSVIHFL